MQSGEMYIRFHPGKIIHCNICNVAAILPDEFASVQGIRKLEKLSIIQVYAFTDPLERIVFVDSVDITAISEAFVLLI